MLDPTLGGLLKGQWAGNPGGYVTKLRALGARLSALGQTGAATAYENQAKAVESALVRSETPEIKDFQAAKQSGYQGSFYEYQADKSQQIEAGKLRAENDPSSIRAAGQKKAAETAATNDAELQQELAKAKNADVVAAIGDVKPARDELQTLGIISDAWQHAGDNVSTGPGSEGALKIKQVAQNLFGIDTGGLAPSEIIQKVGTQLASQASKGMTPRPTQFDFRVFLANNPGLMLSPQGNKAMISILQQQAQRRVSLGQLARQQTSGDGWDDVVTKYDAEHPIVSPLTNKPLDQNAVLFPAAPKSSATPAATAPASQPRLSPEQARALPPGTSFMDQNGNMRVRH